MIMSMTKRPQKSNIASNSGHFMEATLSLQTTYVGTGLECPMHSLLAFSFEKDPLKVHGRQ